MSKAHDANLHSRAMRAYASLIVRRPLAVLVILVITFVAALWGTTRLTINSNQLDLIDQNLDEVKDVKRLIDIVGGAGFLIMGVRGDDPKQLRAVADDLNGIISKDTADVRSVTYKAPVDFIQKNMVLFIRTEDLIEAKKRINAYLRDQIRRSSPLFFEIVPTQPVKLDLEDLISKYSHVGKKSIRDDYYGDDDGHMVLLLIKPMWDSNQLEKTKIYLKKFYDSIEEYSKNNTRGVKIAESYDRATPGPGLITYGLTGGYKMNVDDSYAIAESLTPVSIIAFISIFLITILFFRKIVPTLIVVSGMVVGTIYAMGFAWLAIGQLNMITSILGGILMGFGVDYGIQFIYRTRIELGMGKSYDDAIRDALVNAGRPASVAAVVTGGSFMVLLVSQFRGFSQFGLLAGFGTIIIGFTLFCWSPAILSLIGRYSPSLVGRLIGVTPPPKGSNASGEIRIPRPALLLTIAVSVTAFICAFAVPWDSLTGTEAKFQPTATSNSLKGLGQNDAPADKLLESKDMATDAAIYGKVPTLWERLKGGVRFNYNTRALLPEKQHAVQLQDEINDKFQISADPMCVFSKDLAGQKEIWDEMTGHPEKYSTIDQVVSIYSFVPPPDIAAKNAVVLQEWQKELSDIDIKALPADVQKNAEFFKEVLARRPFGVEDVPEIYASQFKGLPTTKPENQGYLTYLYPRVDLRNGKEMLRFVDQIKQIRTANGHTYRAAGTTMLFGKLARMVLRDGYLTVILATIWILFMHYMDFRSVKLAAASVIPLGVGLVMMLGFMSMTNHQLNFMNIIILPILLGFGVSHGLYLLHRFLEGTSPVVALRSVGAAVASSTLTAIAGFGALFAAQHNGLKSMGLVACLGLTTTLIVSFTVLAAVLQLIHDQRTADAPAAEEPADGLKTG
jgi:predicted RND superfamily exporter protein